MRLRSEIRSRIVVCAALVLVCSLARAAEPRLRLKAGTFDPRVAAPMSSDASKTADVRYVLIQLRAPAGTAARERVEQGGAELLQYVPEQAWIARVERGAFAGLATLADVRWIGPVEPAWKLAPDLGRRAFRDPRRGAGGVLRATIDLFPGEPVKSTVEPLAALGLDVLQTSRVGNSGRLLVRGSLVQLERAAAIDAVAWIEDAGEPRPRNDTATRLVQSGNTTDTPLWDRGLHGEGEIVGHIDGAIELESCFFRDPSDNTPGPGHRKVVGYRDGRGFPGDEHGTHTAGSVAGDAQPVDDSTEGRGLAWAARLSHTVLELIGGSGSDPSNLYDFLQAAQDDGARVHTNSWGDDTTTAYTTWSRDIDAFSRDFEEALVVFATTNLSTLRSPENAKNSIAVGATDNGAGVDTFCSGGTGPTTDGRRKPDLLAPGCGVSSAFSNVACGVVSDSGTSFAAPAVAAAAALIRQYYREGWYPGGTPLPADARIPSGALLKATLLNGAVDVTGVPNYPSPQEGWGRAILDDALYFAGDARGLVVLDDERNAAGLLTGERDTFLLEVTGDGEPLSITLVFTDPPATLMAASAAVNDLDLEVRSPGGVLYRGNVFDVFQGISAPGGLRDARNNVERVRLPAPEAGEWTVEVVGTAVNQDRQGFALVATGRVAEVTNLLRYAAHGVQDAGPQGNGDGFADPGETITLPLTLRNLHATSATGVSAVVSSRRPDQALVIDDERGFGDIAAGANGDSPAPHFRVALSPDVACGASVPFEVLATHDDHDDASGFDLVVGRTLLSAGATDTPIGMPAFSGSETLSTIEVAESFPLAEVDVHVRIAHANIGEMRVRLISPEGTSVTLHDKSGGGTSDLDAVFDTDRVPDGPGSLASLAGETAQGTWTLAVLDDVIGGVPATPAGTIEEWTLFLRADGAVDCTPLVCAGDPVPPEVAPQLTLAGDGTADLLLTWPAVAGASGYRVWRSPAPDFSAARLAGETTATSLVDAGALTDGANWYYRVRAVNGCGQEGD